MTYKINLGKIEDWCNSYKGAKFHAILCDPPYHLTTITKRFGAEDSAPAKFGTDGLFQRASRGFMGKQWDGGDVAFRPETWHAMGEHLYDGAFGMAFASARGFHRMAVAIEDAGFIIHPMIGWIYSSGFPKATRIDTQIDKVAGKLNERISGSRKGTGYTKLNVSQGAQQRFTTEFNEYSEPVTDLAKSFSGYRYGLQALKPALEPIIVFQKPYLGRPIENISQNGAGALNIDAGRIGSRWPANFVISHTPDCKIIGYKESEAYQINRWTDNAHPFGGGAGNDFETETMAGSQEAIWECSPDCPCKLMDSQSKGSDKFFFQSGFEYENEELPVYYCSKASQAERNAGLDESCPHPTVKPLSLNKYLAGILLPPDAYTPRRLLVPFSGVGSEMIGGLLAGWDYVEGVEMTDEYIPVAEDRLKFWGGYSGNPNANIPKIAKDNKPAQGVLFDDKDTDS